MRKFTLTEIGSLMERFEVQEVTKAEWTHEAHLIAAIWYCSKYDHDEALNIVREKIIALNEALGGVNSDTNGYHESITKFWLLVADRFLIDRDPAAIEKNCNDFIQSKLASSEYPLEFYTKELLFSVEARHDWVEPDLTDIS